MVAVPGETEEGVLEVNTTEKGISEEVLVAIFSSKHPSLKDRLAALNSYFAGKNGPGAFAPIKGASCGACRVTIASARLQMASNGVFVTCANCSRFLYLESKVTAKGMAASRSHS